MNKRLQITILLLVLQTTIYAQASRHQLREGNRQYNKQHYEQSELAYRRALEHDSTDARGHYNLGNALYRQKKYDDAMRHYELSATSSAISGKRRAHALHNRGNSMLKSGMEKNNQEQLQGAIESYQEALKLDPKNEDTRYNLSLARRLLQQAQQQQQQQGGSNDQKQQDNKQQQGGNSQQDNNQQEQKQDQNQNQQQDQRQDQGQQQQQHHNQNQDVKKRDADRMLEAMKNNERQTLRQLQRNNDKVKGGKKEKDW